MFTYQQEPRGLHLESGTVPSFPCVASVELTLAPGHLFGEGKGDLGTLMADRAMEGIWKGLTGRMEAVQTPSINSFALGGPFFGGEFLLNGSVATLKREFESLTQCALALESLRLMLPAVLAVFMPRPVTIEHARVLAGDAVMNSQLSRSVTPLEYESEAGYKARVGHALMAADIIAEGQQAVLAACSYLHVSERLGQIGASPVEFMPEMILNMAKALEALFGGSRTGVREGLATLGYSADEIEGVFIPLILLRNEFDVGHAKLSNYSLETLTELHSFMHDAPLAMKELIVRVINARGAGTMGDDTATSPNPARVQKVVASMRRGAAARRNRVGNRPYLIIQAGRPKSDIATTAT